MFCISCYGTNKLLLCDFCTFVQINSNSNIYICDGTRKLHLLYSRVWSTVLAYNYVVIVTCTCCRSCIDIAYKWREGLGLECCARPHVFSVNKSLPWNVLLKYLCESDEGLPE